MLLGKDISDYLEDRLSWGSGSIDTILSEGESTLASFNIVMLLGEEYQNVDAVIEIKKQHIKIMLQSKDKEVVLGRKADSDSDILKQITKMVETVAYKLRAAERGSL